jgi:hypothetical protein
MKTIPTALFAGFLAAAAASSAQGQAKDPVQAQQRTIRHVVIYGRDACPASSATEVVVCARRPDTERYRIPKDVRDRTADTSPESTSWSDKATSLEYVGRTGTDSCSTVGPGGFTGCWAEMMRQAQADRKNEDKPQ